MVERYPDRLTYCVPRALGQSAHPVNRAMNARPSTKVLCLALMAGVSLGISDTALLAQDDADALGEFGTIVDEAQSDADDTDQAADNDSGEDGGEDGGEESCDLTAPCGHLCCPEECCCVCGPRGRFWLRAEYLLWWTKGDDLPPLVTTSPAGTPPGERGVLGAPGTTVLLDGNLDDDVRSGGRFSIGYWLDDCQTLGLYGDYFFLGDGDETFIFSSPTGDPILARPFFDATTGLADSQILPGDIIVDTDSDLQGAGAGLLCNLRCCEGCCQTDCWKQRDCRRLDLIAGYRFLRLDENLGIREQLTVVDPGSGVPVGTTFDLNDSFDAENTFHGGELGLVSRRYYRRWSLDLLGKVALGNTRQVVTIDGSTVTTVPGGSPTPGQGGLLALPSNIGRYERDEFSFVPEVGVTLGYFLRPRWRATVGYSFLYWADVARPGDQIDLVIDPAQLPPPTGPGTRPAFTFNDTDFWAQGINFGVDVTF